MVKDPLTAASEEFKNQYGDLWEIVDVMPAERFGESVISVTCPSTEDRDSVQLKVPEHYKGFRVYLTAPMWGIGGLSLDSPDTQRLLAMFRIFAYNVYGTPEYAEKELLAKQIMKRDEEIWKNMSPESRFQFIANFLRERRRLVWNFGNCGDKYLSSK